ncbi:hypothetical protein LUZ60_004474 [Juncus effusus]|nr:hypothetical protein LUZ60_004474 [Juncus effusus]
MQVSEAAADDNLFTAGNWKLHGGMCNKLYSSVQKISKVFPRLEGARPGSGPAIQALCSLHVSTEKAKSLLQYCSESSKLYLAITGDSVLSKFEKTRSSLLDSLRRVEQTDIPATRSQLAEITAELDRTNFSLDESEQQTGTEIIRLIQKDRNTLPISTDDSSAELEVFHRICTRLSINSSRAALTERRGLKKLLERSRTDNDKRKEFIVSFLLDLMQKYSKIFRTEGDSDSNCSTPCSESGNNNLGFGGNLGFDQNLSKLSSFSSSRQDELSRSMPIPPEELRCPISLQLMFDPVVISSGQTYERACIEKWFAKGHTTCPKTQQELAHLHLTPNICVKGLISSWCDQNGVPPPRNPPDSPNLSPYDNNNDDVALPETSHQTGHSDVGHSEPGETGQEEEEEDEELEEEEMEDELERYKRWMEVLSEEGGGERMEEKRKNVEQIRFHLKDDDVARVHMGGAGFTDGLLSFLDLAIKERDEESQAVCALALFNLAVNNNRNKELLLLGGIIPLLEEMMRSSNTATTEAATGLYLNLSCLNEAKPIICQTPAVAFLISSLESSSSRSDACRLDALYALFNLSTHPPNIPLLLLSGIITGLRPLLTDGVMWADKALAIVINLAGESKGRKELVRAPGLVGVVTALLDSGGPMEQEQAAACLLVLCSSDERCSQMVLQEGAIPALVLLSSNGTTRAKDKAQRLLKLFREQRQKDAAPDQEVIQLRQVLLPKIPPRENALMMQSSERRERGSNVGSSERRERGERGSNVGSPSASSTCSEDGRFGGGFGDAKQRLGNSRSRRLGRALTSMWKVNKKNGGGGGNRKEG